MNSSDLNYRILFDLEADPIVAELTDLTNYAAPPSGTAPVLPERVTLYFKVTTPTGVILNSLITGAGVGTPDIFPVLGDDMTSVVLPLNTSNKPTAGTYSFQMQARVWGASVAPLTIFSVSASANTITVVGNVATAITALIGGYFTVQAPNPNAGVYTVVSATDVGPNTVIEVEETVVNSGASGTFTYFDSYTDYTSTSQSQVYSLTEPTAALTATFTCRTAQLTVTGSSWSVAVNDNTSFTPYSDTRTLSAIAPVNPDGSGFSPTTNTTSQGTLTLSSIYTGVWRCGVYHQLTYHLSSWFFVTLGIQAAQDLEVECSSCACTYFQCVDNLWDKYNLYLTTNTTRAAAVRAILVELDHAWMLYQMAEQCGEDTTPYCNKIQELAAADDCVCSNSTSGLSVPVVAWGSGSGGSTVTGAAWENGSGVPLNTLGNNGDYYLDDDNGNYYKKITGTYVLQGSIKPAAPVWYNSSTDPGIGDGASGDYWINTTTKEYFTNIGGTWTSLGYMLSLFKIHADISDDALIASASPQVLKSYTLPAGTIGTVGDEIYIECFFALRTTAGGETLNIQVNLGVGNLFNYTWTSPAGPNYIRTWSKYHISAANTLSGNHGYVDLVSAPVEGVETQFGGVAVTLSNAQTIEVECTSSAGGVADITAQMLNVYILKK